MAAIQGQQAGREEAGVIRIEEPGRKFLSGRPQLGCLATVPCSSLLRLWRLLGPLVSSYLFIFPFKTALRMFFTRFYLLRNAPGSVEYESRQPGYVFLWARECLREFCSGFKFQSQHSLNASSRASFPTSRWFSFSVYKPGETIVPTLIEAM